jgi:protein SCO1/2
LKTPATRLGLAIPLVVVAAATAAVCAVLFLWPSSAIAAPPASVGTQLSGALPARILNLPLVDENGRPTSLAAYNGKVLMISDTMTLCQETCPMDTADLVQTAREADAAGQGDRVEFLTITIDPTRDTPAQLAAYRQLYQPVPANWSALTGSAANIAALWKYFGVDIEKVAEGSPPSVNWRTGQPLTYDLDHSDEIFFVDGQGDERFIIDGMGYIAPGTPVPAKMKSYLDAQGQQNLAAPQSEDWTVPQGLQTLSWLLQQSITPSGGSGTGTGTGASGS